LGSATDRVLVHAQTSTTRRHRRWIEYTHAHHRAYWVEKRRREERIAEDCCQRMARGELAHVDGKLRLAGAE